MRKAFVVFEFVLCLFCSLFFVFAFNLLLYETVPVMISFFALLEMMLFVFVCFCILYRDRYHKELTWLALKVGIYTSDKEEK